MRRPMQMLRRRKKRALSVVLEVLEEMGSPVRLASIPLSVPSSILTDASLPAPTDPARDEAFVLTFSRDGTGMWTFGDGAAGDSVA